MLFFYLDSLFGYLFVVKVVSDRVVNVEDWTGIVLLAVHANFLILSQRIKQSI